MSTYYMGSNDTGRMFSFTGKTDKNGTADAAGTLKIAGNSAPETKSYTVNYVTEDGASLGTEKVEEGKSHHASYRDEAGKQLCGCHLR